MGGLEGENITEMALYVMSVSILDSDMAKILSILSGTVLLHLRVPYN